MDDIWKNHSNKIRIQTGSRETINRNVNLRYIKKNRKDIYLGINKITNRARKFSHEY